MPTIRSEDIYFADHYNDVYNTYFLKLLAWQSGETFGIYWCIWNGKIHHMSDLELDPEEGFFSYFA